MQPKGRENGYFADVNLSPGTKVTWMNTFKSVQFLMNGRKTSTVQNWEMILWQIIKKIQIYQYKTALGVKCAAF